MESLLKGIIFITGNINEWVGRTVAWLTSILVLIVCVDITRRQLFNETATWILELEWHLFALIFLLGAGYALKHDRHVRVDLFYSKFSARDQAWINLLGSILFLIPWCIVIFYTSVFYALEAYEIGEGSPNPGGLPNRYLIRGAISVGVGLLLLQAISVVAESTLTLLGKNNQEQENNQYPIQ